MYCYVFILLYNQVDLGLGLNKNSEKFTISSLAQTQLPLNNFEMI